MCTYDSTVIRNKIFEKMTLLGRKRVKLKAKKKRIKTARKKVIKSKCTMKLRERMKRII